LVEKITKTVRGKEGGPSQSEKHKKRGVEKKEPRRGDSKEKKCGW